MASKYRVGAIVTDLALEVALAETARALEGQVVVARPEVAVEALRAEPLDRIFIDLTAPPDLAGLIGALKRDPSLSSVPLIGFFPHVRVSLRDEAVAAGLDRALPRSAFFARLPRLIAGEEGIG